MRTFLISYVSAAAVFLAGDFVWLSVMAQRLYRPQIGALMLDKLNPAPGIVFYLIYAAGMAMLCVAPAVAAGQAGRAAAMGALLGLVAYGTYNLSNWATLKGWSPIMSVADMAWGTGATAFACWASALITMALNGPR